MLILHLIMLFFSDASTIEDLCHVRSAKFTQLLSGAVEFANQNTPDPLDPRFSSLKFFDYIFAGDEKTRPDKLSVLRAFEQSKQHGFLPIVKKAGFYFIFIPKDVPGQKLIDLDSYLSTGAKLTKGQERELQELNDKVNTQYGIFQKTDRRYRTYIDTETGEFYVNPIEYTASTGRTQSVETKEQFLFRKSVDELRSLRGYALLGEKVLLNINGQPVEFEITSYFGTGNRRVFTLSSQSGLFYVVKIERSSWEAKTVIELHRKVPKFSERFVDSWINETVLGSTHSLVLLGLEGKDLYTVGGEHLEGKRVLTGSEIEKILLSVYFKLREMHKAGFLFGDLKPENLIVRRNYLSADLIDFQATTRVGSPKVENLSLTPAFLPKRIRDNPPFVTDKRSELFSLGLSILYALGFATIEQADNSPHAPVTQKIDFIRLEREWSDNVQALYLVKALLAQDSLDGNQQNVDTNFSMLRAWERNYFRQYKPWWQRLLFSHLTPNK